ncbi:GNAT family N-acetyltransferase [Sphingomonas morindae]|uniref:GNAT family N-acetyltransferase n=1 Tax=Sphingomonas morindae TaxID=1541170 RepID=A0ABY4X8D8_9SPHN|nr:GNAT family N-acetyltransferase [Sphingomonas morindae]USI73187.1 GNAT family N-acetyltransferase [Sphingomonas morindae]
MFARTDRLLLRPGWREDAPALYEAIADAAIIDKLPGAPWPFRPEDAEAWLTRAPENGKLPELLIYVRTLGRPRLVGGIALRRHGVDGAELDYWIARSCWGLGFATEAGRAVVAMARDGLRLRTLRSGHFTDNPASGRVLAKLGFTPTGEIEKRFSAVRGQDVDCVMYAHAA